MWEASHAQALKFLQSAGDCEDAHELETQFVAVLAAFGFDRFGCVKLAPGRDGNQVEMLATRGLDEWHGHWSKANYLEIDPVSQLSLSGRPMFTWTDAKDWSRRQSGRDLARETALWGEAADAGMGEGFVSHAYGPGGELLVVRMMTGGRSIRPADRPLLDAVSIIFSTMRLRLHEREADGPQGLLTLREQQCLRWASEGLIDVEIADQLAISSKTVAFHMENAKRKLGARTRLAAYRRALELGHMST